MELCKRCGQEKDNTDVLSKVLVHFICVDCLRDNSVWEYSSIKGGIPYTIERMETAFLGAENEEVHHEI